MIILTKIVLWMTIVRIYRCCKILEATTTSKENLSLLPMILELLLDIALIAMVGFIIYKINLDFLF